MVKNNSKHPASFRDPHAFVFTKNNKFFRQLNQSYKKHYDCLIDSGLYEDLTSNDLLVKHKETNKLKPEDTKNSYKTLEYKTIPFISYPYEWSFGQLKEAALNTLTIQEQAIKHGMSLKDASAYNMQWHNGSFKLIDTSSFEIFEGDKNWVAYHQFCQHFLAPLVLMHYTDIRLNSLSRNHIDGIPLDLAVKLLPFKARLSFSNLLHLFLHAKMIKKYEDISSKKEVKQSKKVTKNNMLALCDSLKSRIRSLKPYTQQTEWGDYYNNTNYLDDATKKKQQAVQSLIDKVSAKTIWDIGANNGEYSRLAVKENNFVLACDIDPIAVEQNYFKCKKDNEKNLLPLLMDLTNPSPSQGWFHKERDSFCSRGPADLVMALALIHHLAISNNLPLEYISDFLAQIAKNIIIEFVPKEDSQVKRLLLTREDIFENYTTEKFEKIFSDNFKIVEKVKITGSERTCYLMKRK